MIGFGILGYALRKAGYDVAPLLLAFVIGSMFEQNLRQGLIVGFGDPLVFLTSPISAAFLGLAGIVTLAPLLLARWRARDSATPRQLRRTTELNRQADRQSTS